MNEHFVVSEIGYRKGLRDALYTEIQKLQKERSESPDLLLHTDRISELLSEFVEMDYTVRWAESEQRAYIRAKNKLNGIHEDIPDEEMEEDGDKLEDNL